MTKRERILALVALGVGVVGVLEYQVTTLRRAAQDARVAARSLQEQVRRVETAVSQEQALQQSYADAHRNQIDEVRGSTTRVEGRLDEIAGRLEARQNQLEREATDEAARAVARVEHNLDGRFARLRTDVDGQQAVLTSLRSAADPEALNSDLLTPSVQIRFSSDVGGGVIVYSRPGGTGANDTYVLTAQHVVSDAIEKKEAEETRKPVDVLVYGGGSAAARTIPADIVSYDAGLDLAVLKLRSGEAFSHVAHLAPREKLKAVRTFMPIYTVGCPLGHEPMPSRGDITLQTKTLNGRHYWIVSAPTIFGNSGGGVFLQEGRELIGICSMVCVYENVVPMPVPHMAMIVPGESILDWLDSEYLQYLYRPDVTKEVCDAMRKAMRDAHREVLEVTWEY